MKIPFILLITIIYSEAVVTVMIHGFARTIEPFSFARINYSLCTPTTGLYFVCIIDYEIIFPPSDAYTCRKKEVIKRKL